MNKKEAVVDHSAERDKALKDIGVKFTKEYFKKRYNLGESDFELQILIPKPTFGRQVTNCRLQVTN